MRVCVLKRCGGSGKRTGARISWRACVCSPWAAVAALFVVVCVSTGPSILNRDSERAADTVCPVGRRATERNSRPLARPSVRSATPVFLFALSAAPRKDALVRDHLDKHWLLNVPLGFVYITLIHLLPQSVHRTGGLFLCPMLVLRIIKLVVTMSNCTSSGHKHQSTPAIGSNSRGFCVTLNVCRRATLVLKSMAKELNEII